MKETTPSSAIHQNGLRILAWIFISLCWSGLIYYFYTEQINENHQAVINSAAIEGRASYNKDLVYRRWAAFHGGVYAPATEESPPNPNLAHIPNRDIILPSGEMLTLINPPT